MSVRASIVTLLLAWACAGSAPARRCALDWQAEQVGRDAAQDRAFAGGATPLAEGRRRVLDRPVVRVGIELHRRVARLLAGRPCLRRSGGRGWRGCDVVGRHGPFDGGLGGCGHFDGGFGRNAGRSGCGGRCGDGRRWPSGCHGGWRAGCRRLGRGWRGSGCLFAHGCAAQQSRIDRERFEALGRDLCRAGRQDHRQQEKEGTKDHAWVRPHRPARLLPAPALGGALR